MVEDLFQLPKRTINEYIQETMREPLDLGSVKETEEENSGKDGKRIYSLHDLSKDLKKLRCRSDLFEDKELSLPIISPAAQGENTSIRESDSEYNESSDEEKTSSSASRISSGAARTMFIDKAEPFSETPVLTHGKIRRKVKNVPDPIQEETNDFEPLAEHTTSKLIKFNQIVLSGLQKSHNEVEFFAQLLKYDALLKV